ncbi:MAG: hypothetical protein E7458_08565 [Ruminococcaceae bacterium]|nr:hypothetical protein [Oscillospiraceae bacterium]
MLKAVNLNAVRLLDEELLRRRNTNYRYLMNLDNHNLLMNFLLESGLYSLDRTPEGVHDGWESPYCQLRGHFLGHWLSAAAQHYAATGDQMIKSKADAIIDTLERCQVENGGEWVGPIPEKYLYWIARGKSVWAPQYTMHKVIMGLLDMYEYAGNELALEIVKKLANWYLRWVRQYDREAFDNILDVETGGMLEVWVQLYSFTKDPEHLELINAYYRGRLFDGLLAGRDVLTNMHANTTIPEIMGAARAYEVLGDEKWLRIVKAYWKSAVTDRGSYVTGGQTCGEIWTPFHQQSARLGDKNQEHCTVYNMMRVADFLFRVTGEPEYMDYYELNLYNGIMAQAYWKGNFTHGQTTPYPETGLLTYFLPLRAGARKGWASQTNDFFCCHGTLVQANAHLTNGLYYQKDSDVYLCQYFNSDAALTIDGKAVSLRQRIDTLVGSNHTSSWSSGSQKIMEKAAIYKSRPNVICDNILVDAEEQEFTLYLRIPAWVKEEVRVEINGEAVACTAKAGEFLALKRVWKSDVVTITLPISIQAVPLADDPDMIAFRYGPMALAGLCDAERTLYGDKEHPESFLTADNEREWASWKPTFRVKGQPVGMRVIPLKDVGYDPYTVYFPVKKSMRFGVEE